MKKILAIFSLLLFSSTAYSEYNRYWIELSSGVVGGTTIKVKMREEHKGWALIYSTYDQELFFGQTDVNRETQEPINAKFNVYGVSRFFSSSFSWGYADAGIGLGCGNGTWSENCRDRKERLFGSSLQCDPKSGSTLGIPLHASASLGKYIGIGINIDIFLSPVSGNFTQVGIVIPLGLFTR